MVDDEDDGEVLSSPVEPLPSPKPSSPQPAMAMAMAIAIEGVLTLESWKIFMMMGSFCEQIV
ncbi:MAG: hypothetical protein AAGF11_31045 [Myxococcota bacterium]